MFEDQVQLMGLIVVFPNSTNKLTIIEGIYNYPIRVAYPSKGNKLIRDIFKNIRC